MWLVAKCHVMSHKYKAGQAGGGSFKKFAYIECAQGDQPLRCPNRVFSVNEPSAVQWW